MYMRDRRRIYPSTSKGIHLASWLHPLAKEDKRKWKTHRHTACLPYRRIERTRKRMGALAALWLPTLSVACLFSISFFALVRKELYAKCYKVWIMPVTVCQLSPSEKDLCFLSTYQYEYECRQPERCQSTLSKSPTQTSLFAIAPMPLSPTTTTIIIIISP